MLKSKAFRYLSLLVLLGGAPLVSGCEGATVGVGLGVAVPAPWGGVTVGTGMGGWYGGPRWYP